MSFPGWPSSRYAGFFASCAAVLAGGCLAGCSSEAPASIPPEHWSNPRTEMVTKAFPGTHGLFGSEPVSLELHDLPAHEWVTVRFKLLVVGTWDGSSRVWGPDLWSLRVRGGPQLMLTSFCNMGGFSNNRVQAFPDNYPWARHAAWTGAVPLDRDVFPSVGDKPPRGDSVYTVEAVFPHSGGSLTLDFSGIYNDPSDKNQKWGVTAFEYSTAAAPVVADEVEFARLWDELASADSVRANAAMRKFISTGDAGIAFLSARTDALTREARAGDAPPREGSPGALRLHRCETALRIADGAKTGRVRFALDHLYPEYRRSDEPDNAAGSAGD